MNALYERITLGRFVHVAPGLSSPSPPLPSDFAILSVRWLDERPVTLLHPWPSDEPIEWRKESADLVSVQIEGGSGFIADMSEWVAMRTAFEPKAIYLLSGLGDLQSQALDVRLILADFSL